VRQEGAGAGAVLLLLGKCQIGKSLGWGFTKLKEESNGASDADRPALIVAGRPRPWNKVGARECETGEAVGLAVVRER
jgi:hypothetical protein